MFWVLEMFGYFPFPDVWFSWKGTEVSWARLGKMLFKLALVSFGGLASPLKIDKGIMTLLGFISLSLLIIPT